MALIIGVDFKYWLSGIQKVGFQHTPKCGNHIMLYIG